MTEYGENLLLGTEAREEIGKPHIKYFLRQLKSITRSLPDKDAPIYIDNYINKLNHLRKDQSLVHQSLLLKLSRQKYLTPNSPIMAGGYSTSHGAKDTTQKDTIDA